MVEEQEDEGEVVEGGRLEADRLAGGFHTLNFPSVISPPPSPGSVLYSRVQVEGFP